MDIDGTVFVGILALAVIVSTVIVLAINARDRLLPEEIGTAAIYSEICGARLGPRNWSRPLVQLRVHNGFLVLGSFQPVLLPYSSVIGLRPISTLLGRGIVIEHNLQSAPQPVVIWTQNDTKLIAVLQRYATPVAGHNTCDDSSLQSRG
jgi:hypothetical protein